MVAMQIACEPLVRQVLRQVYQTRGMVNVSPTKKGKKVLIFYIVLIYSFSMCRLLMKAILAFLLST